MNINNRSGYKGVHWVKKSKKWRAKIVFNYKVIHLGLFKDIEDAIRNRRKGEKAFKILKELNIKL